MKLGQERKSWIGSLHLKHAEAFPFSPSLSLFFFNHFNHFNKDLVSLWMGAATLLRTTRWQSGVKIQWSGNISSVLHRIFILGTSMWKLRREKYIKIKPHYFHWLLIAGLYCPWCVVVEAFRCLFTASPRSPVCLHWLPWFEFQHYEI